VKSHGGVEPRKEKDHRETKGGGGGKDYRDILRRNATRLKERGAGTLVREDGQRKRGKEGHLKEVNWDGSRCGLTKGGGLGPTTGKV